LIRSSVESDDQIVISELCKSYNGKKILDKISFSIKQNEILCLLGNNGAGKTTIINILVGLVQQDAGTASIYGSDLSDDIYEVRNNIRLC